MSSKSILNITITSLFCEILEASERGICVDWDSTKIFLVMLYMLAKDASDDSKVKSQRNRGGHKTMCCMYTKTGYTLKFNVKCIWYMKRLKVLAKISRIGKPSNNELVSSLMIFLPQLVARDQEV